MPSLKISQLFFPRVHFQDPNVANSFASRAAADDSAHLQPAYVSTTLHTVHNENLTDVSGTCV